MVGLGDLPGGDFDCWALGVSADGSIVVGQGASALGNEAFRWTSAGGMVGLGDLPGGFFNSVACAVSADGSVVVGCGYTASGTEAFRWRSTGGMVGLGDLQGGLFLSIAYDVSADGSVVVGDGVSASGFEPFIWDALNGMRNLRNVLVNEYGLDLTGWTGLTARGISSDGLTIVGWRSNPSSDTEAWIATLDPAVVPATSLWGVMIVALGITLGAAIAMSSPKKLKTGA
jgi:probable HAF family extracellular repeat protein